MHKLCVWVLALLAAAGAALAATDPWEAQLPDGRTLQIAQDPARGLDRYVLERRDRDGAPDPRFGQGGGTVFRLGPDNDGPQVLRADAAGRVWIAGSSESGGKTQAVVLRFLAQGTPDLTYASAGRSAVLPAGKPARATELRPQADGSAWVAGIVFDDPAGEHAGWWRLDPGGRLDTGFGKDGLWEWPRDSEPVALEVAPGGSAACLVRRGDDPQLFELWVVDGSQPSPRPSLVALTRSAADPPELKWGPGWTLAGGEPLPVPASTGATGAPAPAGAAPSSDTSATRLSDFPGIARPVPAAASAPADTGLADSIGWALGLGAAAGALLLWRRKRGRGTDPRNGGRRR